MLTRVRAVDHVGAVGAVGDGLAEIEVVEPGRNVGKCLVLVAILVEEAAILDVETEVIDAVGHGVDQVLAEILHRTAIALHQVESGFHPILVVAMKGDELRIAPGVGLHPQIERHQVFDGNPAVGGGVVFGEPVVDQVVEAVRRRRARVDVVSRGPLAQSPIEHDRVGYPVEAGPGARVIRVEIVQPGGDILHGGIGVAIFVDEAAVHYLEADMVEPVSDGIDQVLAEIGGRGAIVLHQMEAGFRAVLVVAVKLGEDRQPPGISADPGIDRQHVGCIDLAVGTRASRVNRVDDQLVEAVGGVGTLLDLLLGNVVPQPLVRHHGIGDPVEPGACRRVVGIELRQPVRHLREARICVAVFVHQSFADDLEAQVMNAVDHRVDEVLAAIARRRAVILHQVEPGLLPTFVVAVQRRPLGQAVGANPGIQQLHVIFEEHPATLSDAGADFGIGDRLQDDGVQAIGRRSTSYDLRGGIGAGQARIRADELDELVEPRSRGARNRVRQHLVGLHALLSHRMAPQPNPTRPNAVPSDPSWGGN